MRGLGNVSIEIHSNLASGRYGSPGEADRQLPGALLLSIRSSQRHVHAHHELNTVHGCGRYPGLPGHPLLITELQWPDVVIDQWVLWYSRV